MAVLDCPIPREDWVRELGERNGGLPLNQHPVGQPVEEAGAWEPALHKLLEFEKLGNDWDGFGAEAPPRDLLASAIALAYLFSEKGLEPPHRVSPGVDGSVILEWQFPNGTYADVEIVRPMHAEVMVIEPGKFPKHWTLPTE